MTIDIVLMQYWANLSYYPTLFSKCGYSLTLSAMHLRVVQATPTWTRRQVIPSCRAMAWSGLQHHHVVLLSSMAVGCNDAFL